MLSLNSSNHLWAPERTLPSCMLALHKLFKMLPLGPIVISADNMHVCSIHTVKPGHLPVSPTLMLLSLQQLLKHFLVFIIYTIS